MVKTQVTWEYSIVAQEQSTVSGHDEFRNELAQKSLDLNEHSGFRAATREIETDEATGAIRHHWTREWSNPVAAQEWVDFVLSKGAKSAVVVVE
jgi:hypothetical protein